MIGLGVIHSCSHYNKMEPDTPGNFDGADTLGRTDPPPINQLYQNKDIKHSAITIKEFK